MKPQLSVIIPARNEERYLSACLTSLAKQVDPPSHEVIVVDNNSTDRTAQIAAYFGVKVIRETTLGAPAARNAGAKVARGKNLVFLDADCIAPQKHLSAIHRFFQHHPKIDALVGGYVIYDAGSVAQWLSKEWNYYLRMFRFQKKLFRRHGLLSGNFAIRKYAFTNTGGFDEKLDNVLYAEDTEYAVRLQLMGYKLHLHPNLLVKSSYRRIKRALFTTSIVRTFYTVKHLLRSSL